MVKFTKRSFFLLTFILIGIILISISMFIPRQEGEEEKYNYAVIFYDKISEKTDTPLLNITVNLSNEDYNVTFEKSVNETGTFIFSDLKKGNYKLKVFSLEDILIFQKEIFIDKDISERITIEAQPLTIAVLLDKKPSEFAFNITIKGENILINKQMQPATNIHIDELPLGNYEIIVNYFKFPVNKTVVNLNGTISLINIDVKLVNGSVKVFDLKGNPVNNTNIMLYYNNELVVSFSSPADSNEINITKVPPFKYKVILQKFGANLTVKEPPFLDLTGNITSYNFTTSFSNLTVYVKYYDGSYARGVIVKPTPYISSVTGIEGNTTFTNLPANTSLQIEVERGELIIQKKTVILDPETNNTIEIIIDKRRLEIDLIPKGSVTKPFNSFFIVQDLFNKSIVNKFEVKKLEIDLFPGRYKVLAYIKIPTEDSIKVYEELLALNESINKEVLIPLGYKLKVSTNEENVEVRLIYVLDEQREFLVDKKIGKEVYFENLFLGKYKIKIYKNGDFLNSKIIIIQEDSPEVLSLDVNVKTYDSLILIIQEKAIISLIFVTILVFLFFSIFKLYKQKKKLKKEGFQGKS